jgi:hypothetical protein
MGMRETKTLFIFVLIYNLGIHSIRNEISFDLMLVFYVNPFITFMLRLQLRQFTLKDYLFSCYSCSCFATFEITLYLPLKKESLS